MGLTKYVKKCNNLGCVAHQNYMLALNLGGASYYNKKFCVQLGKQNLEYPTGY